MARRNASRCSIAVAGLVACLSLAACSGGDSGGGVARVASPITGTFVDSPVNGLHYISVPSNPTGGVTANGGQYQCVEGDTVTFDLGGRVLGNPQPCGEQVTVLSVFGATSITDIRVRNLAQLFLTLSGIPAGSQPIELPATIPSSLPARLDFTDPNFEQMLQSALPDKTLVSQDQVTAHLRTSFTTLTVSANGGQIRSIPAGLVCTTGTCSQDFVTGTAVTLAALGPGFTGWSGGGCTGTGTCQVLLTAMQAVRAVFVAPPPPGLSIATSSPLPAGTVGQPYNATLAATGGTPPYTWSLITGTLPAGLTLNQVTGQISGTPTAQGTSTLTFRVRDSSNPQQATTKQLSLTINAAGTRTYGGTLTLTNAPAESGGTFVAGMPFTFYDGFFQPGEVFVDWHEGGLGSVGGEAVFLSYNDISGEVHSVTYQVGDSFVSCTFIPQGFDQCPAGIVLNRITGTLTFTNVVLTMLFPVPTDVTFNGTLTFPPVFVTSGGYPSGIVGQPYSFTLSVVGGTQPYALTLDAATAALPGGLSLGGSGIISGTPTAAGHFGDSDTTGDILVRVTDAQGHFTIHNRNIIIHPTGTTSVPNSRALISGSFSPFTLNGRAFYDGQSRLIGADTLNFFNIGRGTLVPTNVFSTAGQVVRMSRWAGPGRGAEGADEGAFIANQSIHTLSGIPAAVASLPATGQTIYNVLASTNPTVADGSAAPGTGVTGTITVDWATKTVSFNLTVNGPTGAVPFQSGPTTTIGPDGTFHIFDSMQGGSGITSDSAEGSFYGTEAIPQHLGLVLHLQGTSTAFPSNGVVAAVVLQKQP